MPTIKTHEIILSVIEFIAFCLNGLTIFLIFKLSLKEADMWLGINMAILDMLISGFKCFEMFEISLTGSYSIFGHEDTVTSLYAGILFILVNSVACVGYLGLIRWLAICRGWGGHQLRVWWWVYLINMFGSFVLILLCRFNNGFIYNPIAHWSYPDFLLSNRWALVTRIYLLATFLFCLAVVNVCYILIGRKYINQLSEQFLYSTRAEKQALQKQKNAIALKIGIILFLYNLVIAPLFTVDLIELIRGQRSSLVEEFISGSAVGCIAFVNPVILITMHCETWKEIRKLLFVPYSSSRYPILSEHSSYVDMKGNPA